LNALNAWQVFLQKYTIKKRVVEPGVIQAKLEVREGHKRLKARI